ncbi:MAG: tRNA 5-methoxyuridine(34)/uridine 5-oxyacetic acid(34) synthase CmoB [Gammaproteobacteria bacterium]|nr:tRNA 5-methoxyuridine(34)/uridine 5-oxyacetic acid(34) synthase CmoB [Gammaproteobacteria bacterium]
MINIESLIQAMASDERLLSWSDTLPAQIKKVFTQNPHGDWLRWRKTLDAMIDLKTISVDFSNEVVCIGCADDITAEQQQTLRTQLKEFMPWRKGPFEIFGIRIDTEWHSEWKWNRFKDHIQPLKDRTVLDVGCGNGYYAWRMLGAGARQVIGIDPTMVFVAQNLILKRFTHDFPVYVLPLGIDDVPADLQAFDTVFSMGVIYHQRDPLNHLNKLHSLIREEGELVLETLIIESDVCEVLKPKDRYAMMRNVHAIPSVQQLINWLEESGFSNIQIVDITPTTVEEQRATDWMIFQSLENFLDPKDNSKTIEGYPAPVRAVITARK